ncbi:hypothetical protein FM106_27320 [Brachybacterium faecium]|nr:hypothetical protein FM106_27320 [Brachybacterium faecium]
MKAALCHLVFVVVISLYIQYRPGIASIQYKLIALLVVQCAVFGTITLH